MPPLAIVAYTSSICSAVTAIPLPIGIEPMLVSLYAASGSMMPSASPGNSSPVCTPKPNARRYWSRRSLPSIVRDA